MSGSTPVGVVAPGRLARGDIAAPAAPVRIVHLGLGNFFRAHQAWYTANAPDAAGWGIAAFTGRSVELAAALTQQDGLYTLITRAADGDTGQVVGSVSRAHPGMDTTAWLTYLADPDVRIITLTITEAGYLRGGDGALDTERAEIQDDLAVLRLDPRATVHTAPARLVAGFSARRAAGGGPLAVVSCDNLPENGAATAGSVGAFAALLDPALGAWIEQNVSFVTTMVDRITPATTDEDRVAASALTGSRDEAPVVTEPYSEWVLSGEFPAGRPAWDIAGARFVDDIVPFEERKLWLLNGGHSLLAYAGSARGHQTIAEAVADPLCRDWMIQWWTEASAHLTLPLQEISDYRDALLSRFANPRIRHLLAQIAADGSQKLPIRILPTVHKERAEGRLPIGALRALAAWINHLRGSGAPVRDPAAKEVTRLASGDLGTAVPRVIEFLDPALAGDKALVDKVIELSSELGS